MAEVQELKKLFIEGPDGARYEAEVPFQLLLQELASEFVRSQYWPTRDALEHVRYVVDLVHPSNPDQTVRLHPNRTIIEAGLRDGDTLRVSPESRAGGTTRLDPDTPIGHQGVCEGDRLEVHPQATAGCFLASVSVTLATGQRKPIRDVRVGEQLLSCDPLTNRLGTTQVERVFRSTSDSYVTLNGTLHVTASHPIWAVGRWVRAGDLRVGDSVRDATGALVPVASLERRRERVSVWNLFVTADEHTFFADGILVHNMMEKVVKDWPGSTTELWERSSQQALRIKALEEQGTALRAQQDQRIQVLEEQVAELRSQLDGLVEVLKVTVTELRRQGRVHFVRAAHAGTVAPNLESTRVIEIQLEGRYEDFTAEDQVVLLRALAERAQVSPSQLKVIDIKRGSVLVTMEMPEDAALKLMSLYLTGSAQLTGLCIQRIELRPMLPAPAAQPQLPAAKSRRIKILFLAANPNDKSELRLTKEMRAIEQVLRQSEFGERFDIEQAWATRTGDLQDCLLRHKPDLVHFSGHGNPTRELLLEDDQGKSVPVSPAVLRNLFAVLKDNVRCVVLNACFSDHQAKALVEEIDCAIGMAREISDVAAIQFATGFYRAVGYDKDIKAAFLLGCAQIDPGTGEYDIPQIFARNGDATTLRFVS